MSNEGVTRTFTQTLAGPVIKNERKPIPHPVNARALVAEELEQEVVGKQSRVGNPLYS